MIQRLLLAVVAGLGVGYFHPNLGKTLQPLYSVCLFSMLYLMMIGSNLEKLSAWFKSFGFLCRNNPTGKIMIQSIERAIAILEFIANNGGAARLTEIARELGVSKTTTHNIVNTLLQLGYTQKRQGDMRYHLGGRILNLARVMEDDNELRQRWRPVLEQVAQVTGETVYLAVPSGDEVLYLDAIESNQTLRTGCAVGTRESMKGSAIGLVFLAFMPGFRQRFVGRNPELLDSNLEQQIYDVTESNYALDLENHTAGFHCVAIPIQEDGETRACLGLSGPASRLPEERLREVARMLLEESHKNK